MDAPPRISVPADCSSLPWFERALLLTLWVHADRAGVVAFGDDGRVEVAVAVAVGCPDSERVAQALATLRSLKRISIDEEARAVVLTGYHEVQYGSVPRAQVRAASRAKHRDTLEAVERGVIEPPWWLVARAAG